MNLRYSGLVYNFMLGRFEVIHPLDSSGACTIKLFTDLHNKLEFVLDKPFQPSLMFVGEARSLLWSGAPDR